MVKGTRTEVEMLTLIQWSFRDEKVVYSKHARDEMEMEEFGEIKEREVYEVVSNGKVIEDYVDDEPYPSCLIYGETDRSRTLHVVCAYATDEELAIVITVYQPNPMKWINYERRKS